MASRVSGTIAYLVSESDMGHQPSARFYERKLASTRPYNLTQSSGTMHEGQYPPRIIKEAVSPGEFFGDEDVVSQIDLRTMADAREWAAAAMKSAHRVRNSSYASSLSCADCDWPSRRCSSPFLVLNTPCWIFRRRCMSWLASVSGHSRKPSIPLQWNMRRVFEGDRTRCMPRMTAAPPGGRV